MDLDMKRLYGWLLVLTSLLRVRGDVESTLARCCVLGANWAREVEACALFPTPVQGEPSEHQSICLTSAAICCLRFYREQQCEAGKAAAQRGQDCRLPAAEGGEYYKDCCEGCKLGLVSGSMALSCSFRSLQFGFPWDAAYSYCCSQLHPELPALPRPGVEDDTRDNSVLYPGSQTIADSENLCLLFPGQLCAHVCVPVPGSYSCQCRAGFTLSLDKKTCLQDKQGDRCSENDACEHICRDTGVAIECACDPGYRLASDQRTCLDIDECTAGLHSCMPGEQVCYNQDGTYACVNPDGSLTSPWVAPLNTPAPRGPASRGSIAVGLSPGGSDVIIGGAPTTDRADYFGGSPGRCPTGYRYNTRSRVCDDIDECLTVQNLCGRGGLCTNTIGSYTCTPMPRDTCPPGYLFDLPLQSCLDIDECAAKQDNCDHAEQFCINTQGGFACQQRQDTPGACPAGYKYNEDNSACEDVDECAEGLSVCREDEVCRNSVGAYDCDIECDLGFQFSLGLQTCVDIDECREGLHNCGDQECVNVPGSHRCEDKGYTRLDGVQGYSDEVPLEGLHLTNNTRTITAEVKECPLGFGFDFSSRQCLDIDECQGGVHNCTVGQERCINTLGSFRCRRRRRCPPGYTKEAGGDCVDVDECESGGRAICMPGQICVNGPGTFECQVECRDGFRYDPSHPMTCADIDECQDSPCGASQTCTNTEGSYICRRSGGSPRPEVEASDRQDYGSQTPRSVTARPLRPPWRGSQHQPVVRPTEALEPEVSVTPSVEQNKVIQSCPLGHARATASSECEDVDECSTGTARCRPEEVCLNHPGGYRCRLAPPQPPRHCPQGHRFSSDTNECIDVNECEERRDSCTSSQTCINSMGSYRCIDHSPTCSFGYRHDPATRECLDINECLEGRDFCDALTERCTNLPGGYRCKPLAVPIRGPPSTAPVPNNSSKPHAGDSNILPSHLVPPSPPPLPPRPDLVEESSSASSGADTNPTTSLVSETQMEESEALSSKTPGNAAAQTHTASVATSLEPTIALLLKTTSGLPSLPTPTSPTFTRCPPGFKYDRLIRTCKDVDECQASPCAAEEHCRNTLGSFECHCREGYREDSNTGRCKDINECQLGNYDCDTSQRCDNTIGSYTCVRISGCGTGYTLNHNNGLCEDNDECDFGKHDCDQLGPQWVCVNTKGSFRCEKKTCPDLQYLDPLGECVNVSCPQGYTPFKKTCVDIDECSVAGPSPCRPNENCVNLQGSHTCQPKILCGRGFRMNDAGNSCVDIDECATGAHECSGGQECNNRQGTYTCQCPPGYRLDHARQCKDVDECTSFYGAACSSNAACQNTPGSFLCNCHEGFTKIEEGGRNCIDVDECSVDPNVCHHRCINIRGGFQCICNAGYNLSPDNRTCVDVDECEETRDRRGGRLCVGVCENTPGSFQCSCPSGYTLSPDQRTCKDTNECDRPGVCRNANEQCINTRGGHRCMEIMCPQDYIRDNSHKSRCKKRSLFCRKGDLECAQLPLSYSYNFLPLVSNMSLPSTGQVDLFTMRGPLWSTATVHFALDMETTRAPSGIELATRDFFRLRRTSVNQAVISLVTRLEGPQEVQLALSMKLYHENVYSGSAVAKLLILVSEYDF